jgi:serine/arginine repetitive matrix protein 2
VKPSSGPTKGSGRFSLRSLSPAGSAFRRSSIASSPPPNGRIRQSLRSDSGDGDQQRRMHMPSFSKSSSKKARSLAGSSRFADSSDEEDRVPAFSSRFADSSDEDDVPPPSVKGKGLPRTMRNGSSTRAAAAATMRSSVPAPALGRQLSQSPDLPDSSDDEKPQPKQQPTVNGIANGTTNGKSSLQRSGSGRGNMIAANHNGVADLQQELAARPAHKRRGSFMSNILRRKKGSGGKISKGMSESAARKDTPLERSTEELSMIRTNSNNSKSRLQRRGPSWPFPDGEEKAAGAAPEQVRPSTSGGPAVSTSKTKYLTRRSASYTYNGTTASALTTADDDPIQPADTAASQSGKKKKFGTLRKMFRLQD